MKQLLLQGTGTAQQPIINRSYELIQEAYTEVINAIMQGVLGDATKPYILFGCNLYADNTGVSMYAGAIFYDGEIYLVDLDEGDYDITGSDVLVFNIATTYDAVDPITFTDGTTHNVHQIRKLTLELTTSGSGEFDYDDLQDIRKNLSFNSVLPSAFKVYDGTGAAWATTAGRFFGSGSFVKANQIGDIVRLTYNLIIEFNNGGGNDLAVDASRLGFDVPAWLAPVYTGVIRRPSTCQNTEASALNMIENCECIMWAEDPTSNAPLMYFVFPAYAFDGGGTATKTTRKSNGFFNFTYASSSTGTRLTSGSDAFTLTIQGEVTYQSANYDLSLI
jgi:hypothetical protein